MKEQILKTEPGWPRKSGVTVVFWKMRAQLLGVYIWFLQNSLMLQKLVQ